METSDELLYAYVDERTSPTDWDIEGMKNAFADQFRLKLNIDEEMLEKNRIQDLRDNLLEQVNNLYSHREAEISEPIMRHLEKVIMLQTIDTLWKEHLLLMDHLKGGIGLRGYGQKDPKQEYKKEGYQMFMDMMGRVYYDVIQKIFSVQVTREEEVEELEEQRQEQKMFLSRGDGPPPEKKPVKRVADKVGRNDPCPCGSGKKYKKCHGVS
jgi:preprotein translocase subunit SecA